MTRYLERLFYGFGKFGLNLRTSQDLIFGAVLVRWDFGAVRYPAVRHRHGRTWGVRWIVVRTGIHSSCQRFAGLVHPRYPRYHANSGWSWHLYVESIEVHHFFLSKPLQRLWSVRFPWMISQLLSGLRKLVTCFWSPDISNSFPLTHGWLNNVKRLASISSLAISST